MGTTLNDQSITDTTPAGNSFGDTGGDDPDYFYDVDAEAGDTITISGDFDGGFDTNWVFTNTPTFGSFTGNTDGTFSWTFTNDQWVTAGMPASITFTSDRTSDFDNSDDVTVNITCFGSGTMIATPEGEKAVETLVIGDTVLTADGRAVPVKWLGEQTVSTLFANHDRLRLVRIAKGALGNGLPKRDLQVTGDHGMLMDGMLINAAALVNGLTATWVDPRTLGATYKVYHVETQDHDVVLAEGAETETFIDFNSRKIFDNYSQYLDLYGEETMVVEMAYPRISSARLVPAKVKAKLAPASAA